MTRMLWNLIFVLIIAIPLGGCSLFGSEEESAVEVVDTQGASTESQVAAEDLSDDDEWETADSSSDDLDNPESDDDLDAEMDQASLEDDDESDEDFADLEDDESLESPENEDQIDQELANEELDDEGLEESFVEEYVQQPQELESEQSMEMIAEEVPVEETAVVEESVVAPTNQVTNLEYKAFENGGTVVIETAQPADYKKIVDPSMNQIIISVEGATLPDRFKRPYVTKDFKQDIATINAYDDETGNARFVIQMKRPIDPFVQQEGNSILVMTDSGPMGSVAKAADPSEEEMLKNKGEKTALALDSPEFVGEKINLEYIDTDVRDIINIIAERSGVNLIMDKQVGGKTSIRLRDIPWDQALLVLLRSEQLGYVKQGNVLRIAKQSTLSKEAAAVSEQIQNEKAAKLLSGGIKVKYIPVSYADVKELATKLTPFLSKEGKIANDDRTSSLVITDYGEYIDRVTDLVAALDTAPMQVEIEAKLVEARETFIREVGINWDIIGQDFPFGSQQGRINTGLRSSNIASEGFTFDLSVGTFDIFGDLSAALAVFESDNKLKVLSQPRIVTMNKQEATISQTLQVPISETNTNGGVTQTTFRFIDVILGLKVTPQITFKGDVILDVELMRDFAGSILPNGAREINKRQATSTVMVKNGKTAVIGGIYQLDDGDLETGVPLLKDIPLIGYLFKQNRVEKIKNELLLFLKPKILREVEGQQISKAPQMNKVEEKVEDFPLDEATGESDDSNLELDDVIPSDDSVESLEEDLTDTAFEEV